MFESWNGVSTSMYEFVMRGWRWVSLKDFLIDFHYNKVSENAEYFWKFEWDWKVESYVKSQGIAEYFPVWMEFLAESMNR